MTTNRLLRLRYPTSCHRCERDLPRGTKARWDSASHNAACLVCDAENPADPFAEVDPELRGTAGGSAQAEHDRRASRPDHNKRSTDAWRKGADGERHLSKVLHKEVGKGRIVVLDDRAIPGSRANIDHLAIAPSGIYVIDAKNYTGKVERRVDGFLRWRTEHLIVDGKDQTKLVTGMDHQIAAVRAAIDQLDWSRGVPIVPVLCFVQSDWGLLDPTFTVDNVHVLWPQALRRRLRRDGPLDGSLRSKLARLLAAELSPAVPSG